MNIGSQSIPVYVTSCIIHDVIADYTRVRFDIVSRYLQNRLGWVEKKTIVKYNQISFSHLREPCLL